MRAQRWLLGAVLGAAALAGCGSPGAGSGGRRVQSPDGHLSIVVPGGWSSKLINGLPGVKVASSGDDLGLTAPAGPRITVSELSDLASAADLITNAEASGPAARNPALWSGTVGGRPATGLAAVTASGTENVEAVVSVRAGVAYSVHIEDAGSRWGADQPVITAALASVEYS